MHVDKFAMWALLCVKGRRSFAYEWEGRYALCEWLILLCGGNALIVHAVVFVWETCWRLCAISIYGDACILSLTVKMVYLQCLTLFDNFKNAINLDFAL